MKARSPENRPKNPDERATALLQSRNLKMARSAHAYVRGSTAKFYEWLESAEGRTAPAGPAIWICGDCHVGNLGPVANADGKIAIQIRDLDQTVIGNPAHDLIRLGLSLATAARGSDLPGVTTARMLEQMVEGYCAALDDELTESDLNDHRPESVHVVMREATSRSWKQLAKERIVDARPTIPLGKRFWPLSEDERLALEELFATERLRRLATSLRSRDDDAVVEVQDAAYWMKGCSSLGRVSFCRPPLGGQGAIEQGWAVFDRCEGSRSGGRAPECQGQDPARQWGARGGGRSPFVAAFGGTDGRGTATGAICFHTRVAPTGSEVGNRSTHASRRDEGRAFSGCCRRPGARTADGFADAPEVACRSRA